MRAKKAWESESLLMERSQGDRLPCVPLHLRGSTYLDLFVFPQSNVNVFQGDRNGVQRRPGRASSVFISGGHGERLGRIVAGLDDGIIAFALEVVESPVKGDVVRVPVDVAGGGVWRVASQDSLLHLADVVRFTRLVTASDSAVLSAHAFALAVGLPEGFVFLSGITQ